MPPCPADGQSHLSIINVAPIILPVVLRKLVVRPALLPLWLRHPVEQKRGERKGGGDGEQRCREQRCRGKIPHLPPFDCTKAVKALLQAWLLSMGSGMSKKRVPQEDKMLKMVRLVVVSLHSVDVNVQ